MYAEEIDKLAKALDITGCWPVGEEYDHPNIDGVATLNGVEERYRLKIDLAHLGHIGGSALTDLKIDIPPADLEAAHIPVTYVPFRNANLLAAATSWAEVLGAQAIFIGAVEEDSSGYPDCRREFFDAYEQAIAAGTRRSTGISIETPLIKMSKAEIVRLGIELEAPLDLTWSCYQNDESPCGRCDSCALRARGFAGAGAEDPLLSVI